MADHLPRDPGVITDREELLAALIDAFVDGSPETGQHIVDTLGDRNAGRSAPEAD